jgi:phospholipid transport system substrate-binding protein
MHTAMAMRILVVLALVLPTTATAARADGPAAEVAAQIGRLAGILKDPALQGDAQRDGRRLAVRQVVEEIFDFDETARRALGRHWDERSPEERARFVRLFTSLIDRAYLSHLDGLESERIVVIDDQVDGLRAVVRLHVMTGGASPLPVDLYLLRSADRWRVWDARLEGASLVSSYRAQFQKVIQSASWEELLKRLEARSGQP